MIEQVAFYLLQGLFGLGQLAEVIAIAGLFILWIAWLTDHSMKFLSIADPPQMWPREDTPGHRPLFWLSWFVLMFGTLYMVGRLKVGIFG